MPAGRPFSAAAQQPQPWPWPWPVPSPGPGWPQYTLAAPRTPPMRMPSGLFPSGPPRPIFREPFAVRGGSVALGVASGALWIILFGALASNARIFAWSTLAAAVIAWLVALLLARVGDRGAAVGVAVSAAVGLSITTIVVIVRWAGGDWPLW